MHKATGGHDNPCHTTQHGTKGHGLLQIRIDRHHAAEQPTDTLKCQRTAPKPSVVGHMAAQSKE